MSLRASLRDRLVRAATGIDVIGVTRGVQESLYRLERGHEILAAELDYLRRRAIAGLDQARLLRDNADSLQVGLAALRETPDYAAAFAETTPLVTVRIASYQRTEELVEVAIASILAQTYNRFEIVVVNDGPNDATRRAIEALGDDRIRYEEFAERSQYPDDAHARWMVAGSPGMNRGADLATGSWIAPLDEDDSFSPDHLERLVTLALAEGAELAYGALIQRNLITNSESVIWSSPPAVGQFSFQGALYLRCLNPLFRYDEESWKVEEPGDWNLIRRMSNAGVRMATTTDIVGAMNQVPYTHKKA